MLSKQENDSTKDTNLEIAVIVETFRLQKRKMNKVHDKIISCEFAITKIRQGPGSCGQLKIYDATGRDVWII